MVKILTASTYSGLESIVNSFIKNKTVKSIQFAPVSRATFIEYYAMVDYKNE